MLITKLKSEGELKSYFSRQPFIFTCFGCKEIIFPEEEVNSLIKTNRTKEGACARVDYLCREEFSKECIEKRREEIEKAAAVLVFSCGVGVQVIAKLLPAKTVMAGCDSCYLNGFQGLSVQNYDCRQCGECYLNYTGGICPLTACSKGLLNGPCGGAKDGKCEVSPKMNCGWEEIYQRLKTLGKEDIMKESKVLVRDYSGEGHEAMPVAS